MEIRVHEVQVQSPAGGWQGHEFEYDRATDLFQCVNCGRYEGTVTNDDKTLLPCQPSAEWVKRQEEAATRARARKPRCFYSESFDGDDGDPGDYLACVGDAGHDGPHQLAVRNADDY
ncbi:hypothetical protein [Kribbella solani]|uniref:Uncharacterized protein n=1 Tax=Kribbella solani TaxID=236067 RepID=A0A841E6R4_9ACTN|nr:hypothetical protein [Kribbella solani]MBB5984017.1 hypothetical protein [Kribbella solani]